MKKTIAAFGVLVFMLPLAAFAQTTDTPDSLRQQLIQLLIQEIDLLEEKLVAQQAVSKSVIATSTPVFVMSIQEQIASTTAAVAATQKRADALQQRVIDKECGGPEVKGQYGPDVPVYYTCDDLYTVWKATKQAAVNLQNQLVTLEAQVR